jgi:EAL domain-containing protein (putative c-di-GMP-specific phosphodiesterase class I)
MSSLLIHLMMGLKVVAEGVETATQLEILRRFGCDEFQGFLFSGAVPSAEFEHVLMVDSQAQPTARKDGSVLATY